MTSDPAPVHMMGSRPAMMATTVIILGRTRSTAPIQCTSPCPLWAKSEHLRRKGLSDTLIASSNVKRPRCLAGSVSGYIFLNMNWFTYRELVTGYLVQKKKTK
jgi:hypothetical protein